MWAFLLEFVVGLFVELVPLWGQSSAEVRVEFPSAALGNSRTITVLLPQNWQNRDMLPVLVVNDGQDADKLKLRPLLDKEWKAGTLPPFAVVLVPAGDRLREYGVPGVPDFAGRGDRADLYARFLLEELLPSLEARYPLDPANRTILGSSLGGLSAFGLAWAHPDAFRQVGVLSGSFWWRDKDGGNGPEGARVAQNSRIVLWWTKTFPAPAASRFWFQAGTRDETSDRNNNGIIDAIEDTQDLMVAIEEQGVPADHVVWTLVKNGYHEPATWAKVLPEFLHWALDAPLPPRQ
ncbi:MAG: alpha/beta hydrolase-fold protein [Spirochaetales bacterium]